MRLQGQKMRNRRHWRNRKHRERLVQQARDENNTHQWLDQFEQETEDVYYDNESYWYRNNYYDNAHYLTGEDTHQRQNHRAALKDNELPPFLEERLTSSVSETELFALLRQSYFVAPSRELWRHLVEGLESFSHSPLAPVIGDYLWSWWRDTPPEFRAFEELNSAHPLWQYCGKLRIRFDGLEKLQDCTPQSLHCLELYGDGDRHWKLDCHQLKEVLSRSSVRELNLFQAYPTTLFHADILDGISEIETLRIRGQHSGYVRNVKAFHSLLKALSSQLKSLVWESVGHDFLDWELEMPSLETLSLKDGRTPDDWGWLRLFPALKHLTMDGCLGGTTLSFSGFPETTVLQSLHLNGSSLTSLNGLENALNLCHLELRSSQGLHDISAIAALTILETLILTEHHMFEMDWSVFSGLQQLRVLEFQTEQVWHGCLVLTEEESSALSRLTHLALRLGGGEDTAFLQRMPSLKTCRLISQTPLENLASHLPETLESLSLIHQRLWETDLSFFRGLSCLKELLTVDATSLTSLSGLSEAPELRSLVLHGVETLSELSELSVLSETLEELELSGATLLQDISVLQECRELRWLSLTGCSQLESLQPLQKLPVLRFFHGDPTLPEIQKMGRETLFSRRDVMAFQGLLRGWVSFENTTMRAALTTLAEKECSHVDVE